MRGGGGLRTRLGLRAPEGATAAAAQPNVVVVMTDDQTLLDLRQQFKGKPVMPNTLKLIAAKGAEFKNAYAGYPLSCPSRMTFLTGRYAHNHGVTTNRKPGFNYCADFSDRSHTLPIWLHDAGYHTGHMGRYLNGYGYNNRTTSRPGYDEWHAPVGFEAGTSATYYGYYMNDNGVISAKTPRRLRLLHGPSQQPRGRLRHQRARAVLRPRRPPRPARGRPRPGRPRARRQVQGHAEGNQGPPGAPPSTRRTSLTSPPTCEAHTG